MQWADQARLIFPELELLFAIPNGGKRHPATGRRLKAEGVKAGIPDLFLPVARGPYHGMFIEVKTVRGTTTKAQKWWLAELQGEGYLTIVAKGAQAAIEAIEDYLQGA